MNATARRDVEAPASCQDVSFQRSTPTSWSAGPAGGRRAPQRELTEATLRTPEHPQKSHCATTLVAKHIWFNKEPVNSLLSIILKHVSEAAHVPDTSCSGRLMRGRLQGEAGLLPASCPLFLWSHCPSGPSDGVSTPAELPLCGRLHLLTSSRGHPSASNAGE